MRKEEEMLLSLGLGLGLGGLLGQPLAFVIGIIVFGCVGILRAIGWYAIRP